MNILEWIKLNSNSNSKRFIVDYRPDEDGGEVTTSQHDEWGETTWGQEVREPSPQVNHFLTSRQGEHASDGSQRDSYLSAERLRK